MKNSRARRGFTLLELLVAISITLALAGILLSVTTGTLNIWRRVQGNFSNSTQAKLALDYLERDLHSALHRSDTTKWLAVELTDTITPLTNHGWSAAPGGAGRVKPISALSYNQPLPGAANVTVSLEGIAHAKFAIGGAWLRFITLNSANFPVAVSYQLVRRPFAGTAVTAAVPHYFLCRAEVAKDVTLTTGYDVTTPAYASGTITPGVTGAATTLANPALGDVLGDNVVDFGVWLYARTATGTLQLIYPNLTKAPGARYLAVGNGTLAAGNVFPEVADVMVRILSDEGAVLLENMENGRGRSAAATDVEWWALVEQHSQVFVRRIELKGGAL